MKKVLKVVKQIVWAIEATGAILVYREVTRLGREHRRRIRTQCNR